MAQTAADVLIDILIDWGVDTVFGLPGDGINGIMESLRTRQKKVRFIQVRHEEAAAFMACGYAKYTGKLGVCLATSGPGGIHLMNGLYDAKMDGAPVLAITGHHCVSRCLWKHACIELPPPTLLPKRFSYHPPGLPAPAMGPHPEFRGQGTRSSAFEHPRHARPTPVQSGR